MVMFDVAISTIKADLSVSLGKKEKYVGSKIGRAS
jgi:hypothetical protein